MLNEWTFVPTIGAHDFKVKMFLTKGSDSPCTFTMFAIYITGSWNGVGNLTPSVDTSISNERIRKGAILLFSWIVCAFILLQSKISISI